MVVFVMVCLRQFEIVKKTLMAEPIPPLPEGFTDRTAWDAIHFHFAGNGSLLDQAVIAWQRANQDRVEAAQIARSNAGNHA